MDYIINGIQKEESRIFIKKKKTSKAFQVPPTDSNPIGVLIPNVKRKRPYHYHEVEFFSQTIDYLKVHVKNIRILPNDITVHQIAEFLSVEPHPQKCLNLMEKHYTFKSCCREIFVEDPSSERSVFAAKFMMRVAALPIATIKGYQLVYIGLRDGYRPNFNILACCRYLALAVETLVIVYGILPGYVILFDLTHFTEDLFGISKMYKYQYMITYLLEAVPMKIKEIYFFNRKNKTNYTFAKFLEPLVPDEYHFKVFFCTNYKKDLDIQFGKLLLPDELGGTVGTLEEFNEHFFKMMVNCMKWFYTDHDDPYGFMLDKSC